MTKEEKEESIMYFLESLQEFRKYKEQCNAKQNKINEYKKSKPSKHTIETSFFVSEPEFDYRGGRKRTLIPFEDIICYLEELPIEYTEDKKAIQIMLYELAGRICEEDEYKQISGVLKKPRSAKEPPSIKAKAMLAEFISKLKQEGKKGKALLTPYASAYRHGFAKKMRVDDFNKEYGTSIKTTTYNNWMSPVFNNTSSYKYNFSAADLSFYDTSFDELT